MSDFRWIRVSKKHPCEICGRPDWCGFTADGPYVCCMREPNSHPTKNGGYLYRMTDPRPTNLTLTKKEIFASRPKVDFASMLSSLREDRKMLEGLATSLGVDPDALKYLGALFYPRYNAWAFPMKDGFEKIIGIRLRDNNGKKWAVTGSQNGLFIPTQLNYPTVMICEGPTDTAAALTLGYFAVGRPSCETGHEFLEDFIQQRKIRRAIIVPDGDEPGIRGAEKLRLKIPHVMWIPPVKDLREFLKRGGTREILESSLKDAVWEMPSEKNFQRSSQR